MLSMAKLVAFFGQIRHMTVARAIAFGWPVLSQLRTRRQLLADFEDLATSRMSNKVASGE